ncbi:MAG: chorismate mutase [Clostridiales bacterium]|nr:chorismate mutase [Clostridiales bacterium]MDD6539979.1 prephenate dehydratase domain-containing protein [Bacillota bacterium]
MTDKLAEDKLKELRNEADILDEKIVDLFKERMDLVTRMAKYRAENRLPFARDQREREILKRVSDRAGEEYEGYARLVYNTIFDVDHSAQANVLAQRSDLVERISRSVDETPKLFPKRATVACQGVAGAYSHAAAERLFQLPDIQFYNSFDDVFAAVENGDVEYGVLPIENSSYGSVVSIYNLMQHYNFYIVKSLRLRINHQLLAKPGTKLSDIKEIYSHEQAIGQCDPFLSSLKGVKVTKVGNTALAAQMVAESDRDDVAAISSRECADLYGLDILKNHIQVTDNNYTRFICISKKLEIYPGANRISLILTLPHVPCSLYHMVAKFAAIDVNLTKLESRPIPGSDFEFLFYFDLDASVYQEDLLYLLSELEASPETFVFLGCYLEAI